MSAADRYGDPRVRAFVRARTWVGRLLAVFGISLSGCVATMPEKPIVQTVTVERPVAVPCRIPAIERPAWQTERTNPADIVGVSRSIRAELEQRRGYETQLEAAAKSCQ